MKNKMREPETKLELIHQRWFSQKLVIVRWKNRKKPVHPIVGAFYAAFNWEKKRAVAWLNNKCNTRYTENEFWKWQMGMKGIPPKHLKLMQAVVIEDRFGPFAERMSDLLYIDLGEL